MANEICVKCNKELEEGYHLSGLGTCPSCVREWINEYTNLHKGKRARV